MTTYTAQLTQEHADYLANIDEFKANNLTVTDLGGGQVQFGDDVLDRLRAFRDGEDGFVEDRDGSSTMWIGGTPYAVVPSDAAMTIDELARIVQSVYGIDTLVAAREGVGVLVDQISDDSDLWDSQTQTLTAAGIGIVLGATAESYTQGYYATTAVELIEEIANENRSAEEAQKVAAEHLARRDELVRSALRTELPRTAIADAANVKLARLYQIRDGRR